MQRYILTLPIGWQVEATVEVLEQYMGLPIEEIKEKYAVIKAPIRREEEK